MSSYKRSKSHQDNIKPNDQRNDMNMQRPCPYCVGTKNQAVLNLFSQKYSGDGTYYGATTEGTCSYGVMPSDAWTVKPEVLVALNRPQFMGSLTCGMCFKMKGLNHGLGSDPVVGEKLVFVKDLCPPCLAGSVDLALNGDGRWDIEIQAVQCPVGNSKIEYAFQGSNPWYIKLQVRNARIPITEVALKKDGQWISLTHQPDNHWVGSGKGKWPEVSIPVKLTAANGQVLYDRIPKLETTAKVMAGEVGVQVKMDSSLPHA